MTRTSTSPGSDQAETTPETAPKELLPDPAILQRYASFGPQVVEKIVHEFVAYGTHRRQMEADKNARDYDLQKREQWLQFWGQLFAFVIGLVAIGGGLWLAYQGNSTGTVATGGIISGGTMAAIVYAFLKTRKPVR